MDRESSRANAGGKAVANEHRRVDEKSQAIESRKLRAATDKSEGLPARERASSVCGPNVSVSSIETLVGSNIVASPTKAVRILQFEVDGSRIERKFKIVLYVGKQAIEPTMRENRFVVPPSLRDHESVGVRFLSGKYNLFFDQVAVSSFDVDWIVGIDHKPFKQEYVEPEQVDKLKLLYYISFVPKDADGARLVVKVPKHQRTH
jgi:hypothetical protein